MAVLRLRAPDGAASTLCVEIPMEMVPMMWSVWGAAVVLMAVVGIYASRVGKYEESQLFLADSSNHAKSEQDAITARLSRIRPLRLSTLVLAGLMTLLVLTYYVLEAIRSF
jgi:divalent metal cation (Fe/Co/Zn/Cd) transporter